MINGIEKGTSSIPPSSTYIYVRTNNVSHNLRFRPSVKASSKRVRHHQSILAHNPPIFQEESTITSQHKTAPTQSGRTNRKR